jgi:N-acetylmuramoyl-L-alanine amidase
METDKTVEVTNNPKNITNQPKNKVIKPKYTIISKSKKVYGPKYVKFNKKELISKAKCSCGKKSYEKHHITKFKNYCTLCKKSGQMTYRAHYEGEWTCKACGADYCLATGKEKISSSEKSLKKIEK